MTPTPPSPSGEHRDLVAWLRESTETEAHEAADLIERLTQPAGPYEELIERAQQLLTDDQTYDNVTFIRAAPILISALVSALTETQGRAAAAEAMHFQAGVERTADLTEEPLVKDLMAEKEKADAWLLRIADAFDGGDASSMEECVARAEAAQAEVERLTRLVEDDDDKHAILTFSKQLDEARAEVERLREERDALKGRVATLRRSAESEREGWDRERVKRNAAEAGAAALREERDEARRWATFNAQWATRAQQAEAEVARYRAVVEGLRTWAGTDDPDYDAAPSAEDRGYWRAMSDVRAALASLDNPAPFEPERRTVAVVERRDAKEDEWQFWALANSVAEGQQLVEDESEHIQIIGGSAPMGDWAFFEVDYEHPVWMVSMGKAQFAVSEHEVQTRDVDEDAPAPSEIPEDADQEAEADFHRAEEVVQSHYDRIDLENRLLRAALHRRDEAARRLQALRGYGPAPSSEGAEG